ncbi:ribosome biogenesis protein NOP53 isoform X1 [Wyeomyia smithii]|uniref:ribosome biogenesis protein NOP53 isoform X1 n=2 Tax=Wyeomyia smithii TaxID=174621 RepID=UPI002468059D|nr:ribosome biogenesis protein NOP53 isoform X1 [Wyeomyia smithii]
MRRVSKRSKSSWRKHIDMLSDQTFTDEQKESNRTGNVTKTESELHINDNIICSKVNLKTIRKKGFKTTPIFCSSLNTTYQMADPVSKRNIEKRAKKKSKSEAMGNIFVETDRTDIWNDQMPLGNKLEWLNDNVVRHNRKNTGISVVKLPSAKKKSFVPNVEIPMPGASYNPAFNDYDKLKTSVINQEKETTKIKEHFDRVVTSKLLKVPKEDRDIILWNEMSEGLLDNEEHLDTVDNELDGEYEAINPPVKNKKKDRKARNKSGMLLLSATLRLT